MRGEDGRERERRGKVRATASEKRGKEEKEEKRRKKGRKKRQRKKGRRRRSAAAHLAAQCQWFAAGTLRASGHPFGMERDCAALVE